MSPIDEAFIQAYASPQQPASLPGLGEVPVVSSQPPLTGLHVGPHIQLHSPTEQPSPRQTAPTPQSPVPSTPVPSTPVPRGPSPPTAWAPEPIPAPHMQDQTAAVASPTHAAVVATPAEPIRRPLSTFSAPEQQTTAFHPVFEVDGFRWPKITDALLSTHHQRLVPVVEQLLDESAQGRSLIGIVGTRPNVGCTTVLMCLARLIASAGKSVAMVDANFAKASLARDLGLEFHAGWQDVLTGQIPLAECVVKSLQDRMVLLPLAQPRGITTELLSSIQTSVTAGVLRYHYDVVLFNLGDAAESPQDDAALRVMQHCRLDTSIIVADTERTGIDPLDTLLSIFGHHCLGVIGNRAAA